MRNQIKPENENINQIKLGNIGIGGKEPFKLPSTLMDVTSCFRNIGTVKIRVVFGTCTPPDFIKVLN